MNSFNFLDHIKELENPDQKIQIDQDVSQTLMKYVTDPKIEVRSVFPKVLLALLKQKSVEEVINHIHEYVSAILVISEDKIPAVRISLLEQIPYLIIYCNENDCPDIRYHLFDRLLQIILENLQDEDLEIKREALQTLQNLFLGKNFIPTKQIEEQICPKIKYLMSNETQMEICTKSISLMSQIAQIIGDEKTKELFLEQYIQLCFVPQENIRKSCVSEFPIICYVLGATITETVLFHHFVRLCNDTYWGIRKICAESIPFIALMCSLKCKKTKLLSLLLKLISDENKWVANSALKVVGEFISTFANPCITGLVYSDHNLRLINPMDPDFMEIATPQLKQNYSYYLKMFRKNCNSFLESDKNCDDDLFEITNPNEISDLIMENINKLIKVSQPNFNRYTYSEFNNDWIFNSDKQQSKFEDDSKNLLFEQGEENQQHEERQQDQQQPNEEQQQQQDNREENFKENNEQVLEDNENNIFESENKVGDGNVDNDDGISEYQSINDRGIASEKLTFFESTSKLSRFELSRLNKNNLNNTITSDNESNILTNENKIDDNVNDDENVTVYENLNDRRSTSGVSRFVKSCIKNKRKFNNTVAPSFNDNNLDLLEYSFRNFKEEENDELKVQINDMYIKFSNNIHLDTPNKINSSINCSINNNIPLSTDDFCFKVKDFESTNYWGIEPRKLLPFDALIELEFKENVPLTECEQNSSENEVPETLLQLYIKLILKKNMCDEINLSYAYHFPAVLLTVGKKCWVMMLLALKNLCYTLEWKVRKTVAASFDVIPLILGREITSEYLVPIYLELFKDIDEVKIEAVKSFANFFKIVDKKYHEQILLNIGQCLRVDDNHDNWRIKEELAKQIFLLIEGTFITQKKLLYFTSVIGLFLEDRISCVREIAADVLTSIIQVSNQSHRKAVVNIFLVNRFALSENWRQRQSFLKVIYKIVTSKEPLIYLFQSVFDNIENLSNDHVPNIRILVAKILVQVIKLKPNILECCNIPINETKNNDNSNVMNINCRIKKVLKKLQIDADRDVSEISNSIVLLNDNKSSNDIPRTNPPSYYHHHLEKEKQLSSSLSSSSSPPTTESLEKQNLSEADTEDEEEEDEDDIITHHHYDSIDEHEQMLQQEKEDNFSQININSQNNNYESLGASFTSMKINENIEEIQLKQNQNEMHSNVEDQDNTENLDNLLKQKSENKTIIIDSNKAT